MIVYQLIANFTEHSIIKMYFKTVAACLLLLNVLSFTTLKAQGTIGSSKPDTTGDNNINIKLSELFSEKDEDVDRSDSVMTQVNELDNLVDFAQPWKIKVGDDSTWAAAGFDDSQWEIFTDSMRKNSAYEGVAWYRMHFEIDTSLYHFPLAFFIRQFGSATDVYLDGKLLKKFGIVGVDKTSEVAEFSINPKPYAFVFSPQKKHVLAVRYSNFHRYESKSGGINLGRNFKISVKHLNPEIDEVADSGRFFSLIFFATIFLTLAVIHFIMYLYYREKITNLYYSLYCVGFSLVTFYIYYILTSTDFASITFFSKTAGYLAPLILIPLVAMLHSVFYGRLLCVFWVLIILYFISLLAIILGFRKFGIMMEIILFSILIVETIRVIIKAVRRKRDGAWIFAMAILLTPILGFVLKVLPSEINLGSFCMDVNRPAILLSAAILGLPFSMALYLARDFARMGKTLKNQLNSITELSGKTILQEQEKKQILENQKGELERKVVERTREVMQQKDVIEYKNKEITESLVYAKRIQSAILPDLKMIYKTLEESFILYLPKDIVSGDFYGFAQKNDRVLIAAADCTGHGVAGAFMSMIGTALLNQIINEKGIIEPAEILENLNEGIINSLKQREGESNDGMDISLCSFDLKNKELKYAGANRPLWIVRGRELLVYKPNKLPIGGMQVMQTEGFQQHTILLQKGDTVYLFSDGFADQFGGANGKKLMTKKFKDTLLDIQYLSMHDQEIHLNQMFEKWKGNLEQVDDILIIGIRMN